METKNKFTFWQHLSRSDNALLPLQRWLALAGENEIEQLTTDGVLSQVPTIQLQGRRDYYELGAGLQPYVINVEEARIRAFPEDGGLGLDVDLRDVAILKASPEKLLALFASQNGFCSGNDKGTLPPFLRSVGSRRFGIKCVTWLLCTEPNTLSDRTIQAYLQSLAGSESSGIVIVSVCESETAAQRCPSLRNLVCFVPFPAGKNAWRLPWSEILVPQMGLRARDVAGYLWDRSQIALLIDQGIGGEIFLFGHDLKLTKDSRAHRYLVELSQFESEVEIESFGRDYLKHGHQTDLRQAVYDDKDEVRKAIKAEVKDPVLRERGLAILKKPRRNYVQLSLSKKEKLRWHPVLSN